jgi:hypothetical protein
MPAYRHCHSHVPASLRMQRNDIIAFYGMHFLTCNAISHCIPSTQQKPLRRTIPLFSELLYPSSSQVCGIWALTSYVPLKYILCKPGPMVLGSEICCTMRCVSCEQLRCQQHCHLPLSGASLARQSRRFCPFVTED